MVGVGVDQVSSVKLGFFQFPREGRTRELVFCVTPNRRRDLDCCVLFFNEMDHANVVTERTTE